MEQNPDIGSFPDLFDGGIEGFGSEYQSVSEFMSESEQSSPQPHYDIFGTDVPSGLPGQYSTQMSPFNYADQQASPNSSGNSASGSTSMRADSNSSRTSFPGDGLTMNGDTRIKQEWETRAHPKQLQISDQLPGQGDYGTGDGTIDPSSIEGMGNFGLDFHSVIPSDLGSRVNGAGTFVGSGQQPQAGSISMSLQDMHAADASYQLAVRTADTSREVSPTTMVMSNDCSPIGEHRFFSSNPISVPALPGGWNHHLFQPSGLPSHPSFVAQRPPLKMTITNTAQKSRVETQNLTTLLLTNAPQGITRIHLPTHTISKPKLLAKGQKDPAPDMLELDVALVGATAMRDPEKRGYALERARNRAQLGRKRALTMDEREGQDGGEIQICGGCRKREAKRAARKKNKKPEEENAWKDYEAFRVVIFNCHEIMLFKKDSADDLSGSIHVALPIRIACYCRHHTEKVGYQVIFTLTNHRSEVLAQELSEPVMITDDHKTNSPGEQISDIQPPPGPLPLKRALPAARDSSVPTPGGQPQPGIGLLTTPQLGDSSPSVEIRAAKRRKPSGGVKVPAELAMMPLESTQQRGSRTSNSALAATSPLSSTNPTSSSAAVLSPPRTLGFPSSSPAPSDNILPMFPDAASSSVTGIFTNPLYSASSSRHQSRAPSPNALGRGQDRFVELSNDLGHLQSQQQSFHHSRPHAAPQASQTSPIDGKPQQTRARTLGGPSVTIVIPREGSMTGGTTVGIHGRGFERDSLVYFGACQALTTDFMNDGSLICTSPPSRLAGPVDVIVRNPSGQYSKERQTFTYIDDHEALLIRTALTVLCRKKYGIEQDVRAFAEGIVHGTGQGSNGGSFDNTPTSGANFELALLKILVMMDEDQSPRPPQLNLRRRTGQAMLHLACSSGLHRFAAGLVARGAIVDLRDKGGYTPLHMAALNGHSTIVQHLISCGADPTLRTLQGLTAADLTHSDGVLRILRHVERHARSQPAGSLRQAASSSSSLNAMWGAVSRRTSHHSGDDLGSESLEYSSFADEDDDLSDDGGVSMSVRRSGGPDTAFPQDLQDLEADATTSPGLPAPATMAALKYQFAAQLQQLQQLMTGGLQNLPQLPQLRSLPQIANMPSLSQIPNMPQLTDYQAAVLQRLAAMMSAIGGSKAVATEGQPPPPSYEEIFPGRGCDSTVEFKKESVAEATSEAGSDSKCAAHSGDSLDDSESSDSSSSPRSITDREAQAIGDQDGLPQLLQIGRKNAITKEQQENLRRAHAERLKRLSGDRKLFVFWIPLLIVVMFAMLYSWVPGLLMTVKDTLWTTLNNAQDELQQILRPAQPSQGRVIVEL